MREFNAMDRKSEYFSNLSATSRIRYETKVTSAGLSIDPYCIEQWCENLESFPEVHWSDMIVYLTATPSENTREAMKVKRLYVTTNYVSNQAWKGMLDGGCFMRAGWVHQLKLYRFSVSDGDRFVVMGKV